MKNVSVQWSLGLIQFPWASDTSLREIMSGLIICTFQSFASSNSAPGSVTSPLCLYRGRSASREPDENRHCGCRESGSSQHPPTTRKGFKKKENAKSAKRQLSLSLMDAGCVTAAHRVSCHTMNADLFKPTPERGPHQSSGTAKNARNKPEQSKPELAQVVTDSRTGRSYSKGKLLGKVRRFELFISEEKPPSMCC